MSRIKTRRPLLPPQFFAPQTPCNVPVQRCPVSREEASHRILIMRVGAFGDILMGTPLLAALRTAYPDAHLTWIVEHTEVQAIDTNPYIDECIRWDTSYWKKMVRRLQYPLWLTRVLQMRKTLLQKNYDIFVSFQPEEWSLLARGVGAQTRVGVFDTFRRYYRARQTSRNTNLYTHAYSYPNLPDHRIDQYLLTLDALGLPPHSEAPMSMGYTAADRDAADRFLAENGASREDRLVILAPADDLADKMLAAGTICRAWQCPGRAAWLPDHCDRKRQRARHRGSACIANPAAPADSGGNIVVPRNGGTGRPSGPAGQRGHRTDARGLGAGSAADRLVRPDCPPVVRTTLAALGLPAASGPLRPLRSEALPEYRRHAPSVHETPHRLGSAGGCCECSQPPSYRAGL